MAELMTGPDALVVMAEKLHEKLVADASTTEFCKDVDLAELAPKLWRLLCKKVPQKTLGLSTTNKRMQLSFQFGVVRFVALTRRT